MEFLRSAEARFFLVKHKINEGDLRTPEAVRAACDVLFCSFVAATSHVGDIEVENLINLQKTKCSVTLEKYVQKINGNIYIRNLQNNSWLAAILNWNTHARDHPILESFKVESVEKYMLGLTRDEITGANVRSLSSDSWNLLGELLVELKDHFRKLDILAEKITGDLSFLNQVKLQIIYYNSKIN